jgi:hypothetical protein
MSIFDNFTPGPKYLEWEQSVAPKQEFQQQYSYGDRGFFSEMFSNFYRGLGSSAELTGRGLQQFGAEKAGGMLQGLGESMQKQDLALPDYDEYTRDTTKWSVQGTANVMANALASMVGTIGAGVAGTAVAGPVGGMVGAGAYMGTSFGAGTYQKAKEEYFQQHPDGDEETAHEYALKEGASELLFEVVGTGASFIGGKLWLTPALKAGSKALVKSGDYTIDQVIASTIKNPGGKKAFAALLGGASVEGGSEVFTELMQRANAVEYDMDRGEPTNLMNLFVGSMIPGAAMTGVGAYSQSRVNKRMRETIETGLQSEDVGSRIAVVNGLSTRLNALEEGAGDAFKNDIMPLAERGPMSLEKYLQDMQKEAEVESEVINEPEKVLEEAGIPVKDSPYHAKLRTEPPVVEPPAPPPVLNKAPAPDPAIQEGVQRELQQREELEREIAEKAALVAGDLSRAAVVTEAITAGRISDPELVSMYQEFQSWNLNERRKRAIDKGMEQLSEDSNTLDTLDDLDARADVLKRMTKVSAQIKREIKEARAAGVRKGDIPSVPVDNVVTKGDTGIPSREKKGKASPEPKQAASGAPLGAPVSPAVTQADTTPTVTTAPTVIEPAIEGATVPPSATIVPTPTQGTAKVETKQPAPVQPQKQGKKKKVLEDGPEEVNGYTIRKSGVTTKGKQYVVVGKDGVEYAAGAYKAAADLAKKGLVEKTLRPYTLDGRGEAKGDKQEKLQEDQKTVVSEFLKKNEKEYQGPIREYVSTAATELQAEGKELTLGTVRERARKLLKKVENQKKGKSISADAVMEGDELSSLSNVDATTLTSTTAETLDPKIAEVEFDTKPGDTSEIDTFRPGKVTAEDVKEQEKAIAEKEREKAEAWKKRNPGVNQNALQKPEGQKDSLVFHTPDKVYRAESVVGENKRVYLNVFRGKEQIGTMVDNPDAAEVLIKDHRDSTQLREAPVKAEEPKTTVRIRRTKEEADAAKEKRREIQERLDQEIQEELNTTPAAVTFMVMQLKKKHKTAQLAKVALLDTENRTATQEAALKVLTHEINDTRSFTDALDLYYSMEEEVMTPEQQEMWTWVEENVDLDVLAEVTVVTGASKNSYIPSSNTITLVPGAMSTSKIHEIMHALTSSAVQKNTEAAKALTKIREKAKREAVEKGLLTRAQLKSMEGIETSADFRAIDELFNNKQKVIAYGLINNGEFISQIFGSQSFRGFAKGLGAKQGSLLTRFIEWAKGLLGFKNASVYEQILTYTQELTETPWTGQGEVQMELRKSPPDSTAEAQAILKQGKKEKRWRDVRKIQETMEDYLRPVTDRIRVISEKIYSKLIQYESSMVANQKRYSNLVAPFMRFYGKLSKEQQVTLDLALMNSHLKKNQEFLTKFIPAEIKGKLDEALKDLNQRMLDVGIGGTKENPYYFPRRVKDMPGLLDALHKGGMLEEAMEQEKRRLKKPVLSEAEKSEVVTKMFLTGRPTTLPRPGASKQRTVPWVDKDTYQFYDNSTESLMGHIFEMNEKLGAMEFIGRSDRKKRVAELRKEAEKLESMKEGPERDQLLQAYIEKAEALENTEEYLKSSLGIMVGEEMQGKSSAEQMQVVDLINARLRQRGAHGIVDSFRNLGYITTMGNFLSAITQLGDIPIIFYAHGLNMGSMKAVGTAFKNVGKVAWAELRGKEVPQDALVTQADFTNALREFSNGNSLTGQWVEKVFKISGLKYVDLIGKEAQMQAAQAKYKGGKNDQKFMDRYEPMFGKDTTRVLQEFKDGKRSQDTLTVLLSELSDWQPIFMSAQSKVYMTSGNGRLFYMLKTFTLRTTSAALREGVTEWNKGGAKSKALAVGKVAGIILLYAAAGAGTDEIKDILRGRDDAFLDTTMDNFWQMFLLSRYATDRGLQKDNLASEIMFSLAPPVRYLDGFAADIWAAIDDEKDVKFKTLQSVPLLGSIGYARSEAGTTSYASMKKKDILEMVRENRKKKKPPYTGDVKDAVKKHNERVTRDKWITNDTIMRAYKND